ncbi:MAG TPA: CBS domain-containing protein [Actinomycetota bacterium]|nr:CBS domain-containing protein [Actinomycetota bacterium]
MKSHSLFSVPESASVAEAARLMCDRSIGALGITGATGELTGIVTERDVTWLAAQGRDLTTTRLSEVVNDFPVVLDGPIGRLEAAVRMRDAHAAPLAVDVMTSPAVACREDAYLEEVADVLADRDVSGLPVVDEAGRVTGVVSERDLAHALGGPLVRLALRRGTHHTPAPEAAELPRDARRVRDVMTAPPIAVAPDTPLPEVAFVMSSNQVNRVPVLSGGELVGILTRGDVLAGLSGHVEPRLDAPVAPPVVVGGRGRVVERSAPFAVASGGWGGAR